MIEGAETEGEAEGKGEGAAIAPLWEAQGVGMVAVEATAHSMQAHGADMDRAMDVEICTDGVAQEVGIRIAEAVGFREAAQTPAMASNNTSTSSLCRKQMLHSPRACHNLQRRCRRQSTRMLSHRLWRS